MGVGVCGYGSTLKHSSRPQSSPGIRQTSRGIGLGFRGLGFRGLGVQGLGV